MSTGKRLAKRSIIGTRVCAPGDDGKYYAGVIHAVKTPAAVLPGGTVQGGPGGAGQGPGDETRYSVRFDTATSSKQQRLAFRREFRESELIGPGFRSVTGCHLQPGQRAYLTFNGREVAGEVRSHDTQRDEVVVTIWPPGHEGHAALWQRRGPPGRAGRHGLVTQVYPEPAGQPAGAAWWRTANITLIEAYSVLYYIRLVLRLNPPVGMAWGDLVLGRSEQRVRGEARTDTELGPGCTRRGEGDGALGPGPAAPARPQC
ncbi:Zinc finger protein 395 [Frankliniella fusca]|uniref:Zinc finger protein 395 n=1 Tax=Frankliniella fusca TaxID=407009 RepID=A0AAE1LCS0_9NEOP|nr:Zinc finger protein 395 [Frankliniella fusca]